LVRGEVRWGRPGEKLGPTKLILYRTHSVGLRRQYQMDKPALNKEFERGLDADSHYCRTSGSRGDEPGWGKNSVCSRRARECKDCEEYRQNKIGRVGENDRRVRGPLEVSCRKAKKTG